MVSQQHGIRSKACILYAPANYPSLTAMVLCEASDEKPERNKRPELTAIELAANAAFDGIGLTSPTGHYVYVNPSHVKLFGYEDASEFIGQHWSMLYDDKGVDFVTTVVFPILNTNGSWRGRLEGKRKDETRFVQELSLSLLPDGGIACICSDATERIKAIEHSEQLFRACRGLLIVCDFNGMLKHFNPALVDLLGYSEEDLSRCPLQEFVHQDDKEATLTKLREIAEGHVVINFVNRYVTKTGRVVWLDWSAIPSTEAGLIYASAHDVSTTKLAETAIIENATRAQRLIKMKSHFVSTASHELRTPLANMMLACEMLKEFQGQLSQEKRNELLQTLKTTIQNMVRTVETLLLADKADSMEMACQCQAVTVDEVIEALRSRVLDLTQTDRVRFLVRDLKHALYIDPDLYLPVVRNLLENALKYSPSEEPVECEFSSNAGWFVTSVRDRGCGVPEPQRSHLFNAFFRASNVGPVGGSGLGLFLSQRLATAHRGSIVYHPRHTGGSEFSLRLPLERSLYK